ncbi:MAG: tRNA (guanosine(46)-N7)-methyltransferase TrmB [Planctomycetota bacterium]|jgi:tRNA (guanine-N7-)-methyltransferase
MSTSLTSSSKLDPGHFGLRREDLPALGDRPEQSRCDLTTLWPEGRRDRPYELEIGSGKGTFLVQQAEQTPEINYLGVEYAAPFWLHAADRVRRHGFENVRVLHADAKPFVAWQVPDAFFQQIHIYFADPWPKKRHHKRRYIEEQSLTQFHRVLSEGGKAQIVTDHEDYYAWIEERVASVSDLFERRDFENPVSAGEGEVVGTNFERKYRREGRPFNAMTLVKK